ncbi:MAG: hypothetical protein ACLT1X_08455 [Christensenellales bacterium]
MDELRLAIPDESLLDEIAAYRQAMLDADSSMDGCGPLKRMENPAGGWRSAVSSIIRQQPHQTGCR